MKVDKISGDLRQAFDILRNTINNKVEKINEDGGSSSLGITYEDTNRTINRIF